MPNRATLVPDQPADVTVYFVLDDLRRHGRVWRETDETCDEATVIGDILDGQFSRPVRIVAFNIAEGWSRDVTEDVARAMVDQARRDDRELSAVARDFYILATGEDLPAGVS